MNQLLKIEPQGSSALETDKKEFPFCLRGLVIHQPEPTCPFCGKELRLARCSCPDFNTAQQNFLASYGKDAFVQTAGIPLIHVSLTPEDMLMEERSAAGANLGLFVGSQIVKRRDLWEISPAEYNPDQKTLVFCLRAIGSSKLFRCTVVNFMYTPAEMPQVCVVHEKQITVPGSSRRFGDYSFARKRTELGKFAYEDFLQKITDAFQNTD